MCYIASIIQFAGILTITVSINQQKEQLYEQNTIKDTEIALNCKNGSYISSLKPKSLDKVKIDANNKEFIFKMQTNESENASFSALRVSPLYEQNTPKDTENALNGKKGAYFCTLKAEPQDKFKIDGDNSNEIIFKMHTNESENASYSKLRSALFRIWKRVKRNSTVTTQEAQVDHHHHVDTPEEELTPEYEHPTITIPKDSKTEDVQEMVLFMPNRPIPSRPENVSLLPLYELDCLYDQRKQARSHPNTCYVIKPNSTLRESYNIWMVGRSGLNKKMLKKNHRKIERTQQKQLLDQWEVFWNDISHDFAYTFDFVLWNGDYRNRKEIHFWYLMLYLKSLAVYIESPKEVFQRNQLNEYLFDKGKVIENLLNKKKLLENKTKRLKSWIERITSAMKRFTYDKTVLLQQMDVIRTKMALYDGEKEVMEKRLEDIRQQTEHVEDLVNRYLPVVKHINKIPKWTPNRPRQLTEQVQFDSNRVQVENS